MLELLYNIVLGEKGFLVKIRNDNYFDDLMYVQIKTILKKIIKNWKSIEEIPKKGFLTILELQNFLTRNSNFLSEKDFLKVENASIEIKDIIDDLWGNINF